MHLKSLKITNFRKFRENNNVVKFVGAKDSYQVSEKINVAPSTTLIVGKNNSGKTTITKALDKLVNGNKFIANDFNFNYLTDLLDRYCDGSFEDFPCLEFEVLVGIDVNSSSDLVTNVAPFLNIASLKESDKEIDCKVVLKYVLKETPKFKEEASLLIAKYEEKKTKFRKFLELINSSDFKMDYYGSDGTLIGESNFKLSELIGITIINANKVINDKSLSRTFNKIINFRYKSKDKKDVAMVDSEIDDINKKITSSVSELHTVPINNALNKIESSERLEVELSADLTFEGIMTDVITYEYKEGKHNIPEGQFGLGYSNLMAIIGELIEYIEKYPQQDCHSKINLICIEEPEAFMHSQMQELFIKYINDAVAYLIDHKQKQINSQLIITTHSSHILNSKIHSGNSFDNISYITIIDSCSNVVNLNDKNIMEEEKPSGAPTKEEAQEKEEKRIDDLKFLKKHIKYKVSELFFSDAVIFVEGVTEETLLTYYIDQDEGLNKIYISIFNINGAHGLVYHPLIKLLKVPALIITDLDIKRTKEEKNKEKDEEKFLQISDMSDRKTTNATISKFNIKNDDISSLSEYFEDENIYVVFQREAVGGYYATSFEEAFILSNYENDILNKVLESIKPDIYKGIVGGTINKENLKKESYKLQRKISNNKSDFSNELLYEVIVSDGSETPKLPKYILDGLSWLKSAVENQVKGSAVQ